MYVIYNGFRMALALPSLTRLTTDVGKTDTDAETSILLPSAPTTIGNSRHSKRYGPVQREIQHAIYSFLFAMCWCLSILSIPVATGFITYAATDPWQGRLAYLAMGVLLVLFTIYTCLGPTIKHQIRAGVFPFSLRDMMPRTEDELIQVCRTFYLRDGKVQVVSHAWSFYLTKLRAIGSGNRVWTLKYTGEKEDGRWRAGTTVAALKRTLAARGRALAQNPSMEFLSLGSWISTASHGHPGTWTDSVESGPLDWVSSARVVNLQNGEITDDSPVQLLRKFATLAQDRSKYLVIDVQVRDVENFTVQRYARSVDSLEATAQWLEGTHLRLMFIGSFGALGVIWNALEPEADVSRLHMHPHCCSSFCFWLTADFFATLPFSWMGNLARFDGLATLGGANSSINPAFYPVFTIWPQICCVYNLELFIPWIQTPERLWKLVNSVQQFHANYGGRSEIRVARGTLFVDLSLRSRHAFSIFFSLLKSKHGIDRAAQHLGKYRLTSIEPLREIPVSELFT